MSLVRDDIYEYSLDAHHDEAAGKALRKKIYWVLALLSVVTMVEVGLGFKFGRVVELKETLKWVFILLTLFKAGYIVMVFMHLGDEKKNLRAIILVPYFVLVGYLIFICLDEAIYSSEHRAGIETSFKELNAKTPAPAHDEHGGGEHGEGGESHEGHH